MKIKTRYDIKSILLTILWISTGAAGIVLLVAAVNKKDQKHCMGIEINISGVSNNFFIDKDDVRQIIAKYAGRNTVGKVIEQFNLVAMESALKKDVWIKNAELFFDNNDVLQAVVEEREPVARIFTKSGSSFYIDSSNMKLPLSEKLSARLPVFSNFPSEIIGSKADSNLIKDIKTISLLIQADPFLMAMIEQVDITPVNTFEMVPKMGNQVIVFGDASEAGQKFHKLKLFYKKVMTKMGWSKYSVISLQYRDQVVAKVRGKDDFSADSLRTIRMMEVIAANAERMSEDTAQMFSPENDKKNTDSSMIQQSLQRDDVGDKPGDDDVDAIVKPVTAVSSKPVAKPKPAIINNKIVKRQVIKPVVKPVNPKPKVLMPKKNEY